MEFQTYYPQSRFVHLMLEADKQLDDEGLGRDRPLEVPRRRKRGRGEEEGGDEMAYFKRLVSEWDHVGIFPTFKTFVDSRFYMQLALNQDKPSFNELAVAIQEFRKLVSMAEKALYQGDVVRLGNLVVGEFYDFLINYQQLVILFTLQCSTK
jgi:hypothetical protein